MSGDHPAIFPIAAPAEPFRAELSVFRGCCVMCHIYFPWTPPHNRRVVLPFA